MTQLKHEWEDKDKNWQRIQIGQGFKVIIDRAGIVRIEDVNDETGVGFTIDTETAQFIYEYFNAQLEKRNSSA